MARQIHYKVRYVNSKIVVQNVSPNIAFWQWDK